MSWLMQERICFSPVFVSSRGRWSRADGLISGYHQETTLFILFPTTLVWLPLSKSLQKYFRSKYGWLEVYAGRKERREGRKAPTSSDTFREISQKPPQSHNGSTFTHFSVATLCIEAWDMFSFRWINCYSCYIGILLVKNKRNNENLTANSQSLPLVKPLIFTFCESSTGVTKWWYPSLFMKQQIYRKSN